MSFNKIILVGNLGRDPELRYTPQGIAVATFSMATNERKTDKLTGEKIDVATWFKITLWRQQAENAAKYLLKGSPVYIEGRLQIEEWTDRDNNNRYSLVVQATDMQFIGSKAGGDEYNQARDDYPGAGTPGPGHAADVSTQPSFPTHAGSPAGTPEPASPAAATSYISNAADDDIPF